MSTTGPRLDRPILVSLVLVGMAWLLAGVPPWGDADPELFALGTAYVVAGATWYAVRVTRPGITAGQEARDLAVLWLAAVLLWAVFWLAIDPVFTAPGGLMLGTLTFAMWQLPALAGRAVWRRLPRRTTAS